MAGETRKPEWIEDAPSAPADDPECEPVRKVTVERGGAKRDGYFKRRDYPEE